MRMPCMHHARTRHVGDVYTVSLHPSEAQLVSAGYDKTVRSYGTLPLHVTLTHPCLCTFSCTHALPTLCPRPAHALHTPCTH